MASLSIFTSSLSLLLLLSLSFLFSKEAAANSLEAQKQREFDYFAFALQWPGTFCRKTHHCCSQNGCCRPEPLTWFTIHGLWPDYDDGTWPACCSHTEFDIKKVSSLLPTLEKYWPTLSCGSTSQCDGSRGSFWAHEWGKHGTCSYAVIQDEYSYFSKALELYFKYNVTEILNDAGFFASNAEKYRLGDIVAAVKHAVGATPELVCKHGSVQELRICLTKDFKPRDCLIHSVAEDNASNSRSSCPRSVSLPSYEPLVLPQDVSAADSAGIWFS
ncbi:uncharacterized protein A4U43_C04F18810 [Asparagus officinalis]|uniref:Uncharacterized protein n=1 Tax=Asparagus officinalis TaxID=4686 RepID=A0A5P1F7A5_ASPOF|nr:ribonuclease 2 [Asparagus officinalis]ONK72380.1 uncharacterized protein A4U43_C04F18810 [Asparagus officinalis]